MTVTDAQRDFAKRFNHEVLASMLPLAQEGRALLVAQAAVESGWGTAFAFRHGFNFGNVTAGPGWRGRVVVQANGDLSYAAAECARLGRPMSLTPWGPTGAHLKNPACLIDQNWRVYPTTSAAIEDHWNLLGWQRYLPARHALEAGDLAGFAHHLGPDAGPGQGGYYTLPEAQYAALLSDALATVRQALAVSDPDPTPPLAS